MHVVKRQRPSDIWQQVSCSLHSPPLPGAQLQEIGSTWCSRLRCRGATPSILCVMYLTACYSLHRSKCQATCLPGQLQLINQRFDGERFCEPGTTNLLEFHISLLYVLESRMTKSKSKVISLGFWGLGQEFRSSENTFLAWTSKYFSP